ncbi:FecCD family ABC transporter permease [Bacillus sonorensis]|uniref:FecCD family ABC transporter permease n=1 Tax=Bacillus sonorensis TaxID=119858 RepID=UPI00227FCE8A|nr:iron ABC transporter permease [Bacillus sonorensis]MCY8088102.1 iron ABC transporter permease [Bacillus sonorensis]MCY8404791.1 iron ABC transporter permease [Bacillus sonorensis]
MRMQTVLTEEKRNLRRKWLFPVMLAALLLVMFYGLTLGSVHISLADIWAVFTSRSDPVNEKIVMDLRLPRVLTGLLVGASLAASGSLLQGVVKNPLADPGIIGVTAGGGLAAVTCMILLPQYIYLLPAAAFLGAFLASLVVYGLSWDQGTSPLKLILAGVAVNALLGAVMNGLMVVYSDRVQAVLPWLAGGLNGRSWHHLGFMAPYAIGGLVLCLFAIKPANILRLGDDSAKLLGQNVELTRFFLIVLAALLAGAAVSVAGLVGFVGLVVPHVIRLLIGDDYRFLLPLSVLCGGILVVLADTAARVGFSPVELPVGILLACLGAPFFLYLLKTKGGI